MFLLFLLGLAGGVCGFTAASGGRGALCVLRSALLIFA